MFVTFEAIINQATTQSTNAEDNKSCRNTFCLNFVIKCGPTAEKKNLQVCSVMQPVRPDKSYFQSL